MRNFFDLESSIPSIGSGPISIEDLQQMTVETASEKEALSRAVKAITILFTRIMTVDSCIGTMRTREPFSGLDKVFERILTNLHFIEEDCLRIFEFCVAENVIACQTNDKVDYNDEDDLHDPRSSDIDIAADAPEPYGEHDQQDD